MGTIRTAIISASLLCSFPVGAQRAADVPMDEEDAMAPNTSGSSEVDTNCPELLKRKHAPRQYDVFFVMLPYEMTKKTGVTINAELTFAEKSKKELPLATCRNFIHDSSWIKYAGLPYGEGVNCINNYTNNSYNPLNYEKTAFSIENREEKSDSRTLGGRVTPTRQSDDGGRTNHCGYVIEDKVGQGFCFSNFYGYLFSSIDRVENKKSMVLSDEKWMGAVVKYGTVFIASYQDTVLVAVYKTVETGFYCGVSPKPRIAL